MFISCLCILIVSGVIRDGHFLPLIGYWRWWPIWSLSLSCRYLSLTWHGLHHFSQSLCSSFPNTLPQLPQLQFALLAKYRPGLHHTPRSLHRTGIDYWQNYVGSWFRPSSFFFQNSHFTSFHLLVASQTQWFITVASHQHPGFPSCLTVACIWNMCSRSRHALMALVGMAGPLICGVNERNYVTGNIR